jgi:two-component system sensor histidine kinase YesM
LDYRIEVDDDLLDGTILKLTLQPLAENALYHGIKNKRNGGTIIVRAKRGEDNQATLEVEDDGVGFTPYKLSQVRSALDSDFNEVTSRDGGFGLENVNKRVKLYYGKEYNLSIDSQYLTGTKVTLHIPLREVSRS